MQFHSFGFLLLAAATVAVYYLVPRKIQWWVLLGASYLYYALSGVRYLLFLLFTTGVTFLTAGWMQKQIDAENAAVDANREVWEKSERKAFRESGRKKRLRILLLGLLPALGVLAVLKYTGFAVSTVNAIANTKFSIPSLLLPLGLSFYTFQSVGYLIDVYRKKAVAERNFFRYALFVSYFPQLVQGPISRFGDLEAQFFTPHNPEKKNLLSGFLRILWGFFKKLVIADTAMVGVRFLVERSDEKTGVYVFLLILLYSAEIYGDFTGGIDVTIGLSEMLGIRLKENFNRPFSSVTVREYWNRWHITMGSWFTDYIFYPLSVSDSMQKLSKKAREKLGDGFGKRLPVYTATVVTWFLTGLWHGAGWNFIVWGMLNCFAILISEELRPLWNAFDTKFDKLVATKGFQGFRAVRTFLIMGLFRSLDCYRDVGLTFRLWGSMFSVWNAGELFRGGITSFGMTLPQILLVAVGSAVVFFVTKKNAKSPIRATLCEKPVAAFLAICLLLTAILIFGAYGIGYDASDFIYGQF